MDNQQLNESYENIVRNVVLSAINGKYTNRKEIYKELGISKNHILAKLIRIALDKNRILIYRKHTKETLSLIVKNYRAENGRLPTASKLSATLVKLAQKFYGTWNRFLLEEFGEQNQRRYADEFSDKELLDTISNYVQKYQRIPSREEFDGKTKNMPYWESFTTRFGHKKWSEIIGLALVNNPNIKIYHNRKNGFGKIILYNNNVFLSRHEYLIAKYLTENNIKFEKEVEYENCTFVFDFYLPELDVYVEYYGIATTEYMARVNKKRAMYNGRNVIEIFKHDNTIKKLDSEVQRLQSSPVMREGIVQTSGKLDD